MARSELGASSVERSVDLWRAGESGPQQTENGAQALFNLCLFDLDRDMDPNPMLHSATFYRSGTLVQWIYWNLEAEE